MLLTGLPIIAIIYKNIRKTLKNADEITNSKRWDGNENTR